MTSRPLRSTAIAAAGYDPDTQTLEIEFANGRAYTYEDVPPEVYEGLVNSNSPGRYFLDRIKDVY